MSTAQFNIAMMLRLTGQGEAKAGLAEVSTGMKGMAAEAVSATAAGSKQAGVLHVLANASDQAASSVGALRAATASSMNVWRGAETAAGTVLSSINGINAGIRQQASDLVATRQEAALYQQMLDDVRASFNPIFAAQQRYEQQLGRIAEAEQLGAINAIEAADARKRAASMAQMSGAANINSQHTGNVAFQGFDVLTTAAMGMDPLMIGFQQGPQFVQVFQQMGGGTQALKGLAAGLMSLLTPMSLATIGMVALGAVGIQQIGKLIPKTKTLGEALEDLAGATDTYAKSSERARMSTTALQAEFGSASDVARKLLEDMAELDRRAAGRGISDTLKALPREFGVQLDDYAVPGASDLKGLFGVSGFDREGMSRVFGVESAMKWAVDARGTEQQIKAVETLRDRWREASEAERGVSEKEDAGLRQINTVLEKLAVLRGVDENAAGREAAQNMARDLERQAALDQTILRYGEQSAEARAMENRQEREALQLKLQDLKITRDSTEGRRALAALDQLQALREAEAQEARRNWLQDKDDRLNALRLEISLIGQSNAEQARSRALAEAELEIRDRKLGVLDAILARTRAVAIAAAEASLEQEKAARAAQVTSITDAFDARIGLARDPMTRADLEAQREYARIMLETSDVAKADAEAQRIRARAISETTNAARVQAADLLDEVAARQQVAAQVAAGTVMASDANRVLQQELQLRPLIAAAARAEGAEKRQLTEVITGLRLAYAAQAIEERRQAQNDYLRGAAERVQQAKLELALAGQSAEVRARILAMVQAEREIRELGLTGAAADDVRARIDEVSQLNREIERQAGAWETVQSAGENAIDGILDALKGGDVGGAFEALASEIGAGFFDLAVRNPLKNLVMGTNLGTLGDVGGVSGIFGRLTGKAPLDEKKVVDAASAQVQAMTIAATAVTINAGAIAGVGGRDLLNGLPGAANSVSAPGGLSGLTGSASVQEQAWRFFAAKGMKPHQIAGIMGNISGESGFNPLAEGDGGDAHGLFQWNDRRHKLFDFIGGKGNLGNVQGQLEFAWQELQTTESAAYKRLMASTDVRGATDAFMRGFERPSEKAMVDSWGARLGAAEEALTRFGGTAQTATTDLSTLGTGMGGLGEALAGALGGQGGSTGWVGVIASLGGKALGIPGFRDGGATPPGNSDEVGGIVHKNEYVFNAAATARIGVRNLDALQRGTLRGFRSGGYVSPVSVGMPAPSVAAQAAPSVVIHNYSGQPVREEQTVDAHGQRQAMILIGEQVGAAIVQPGNPAQKAVAQTFGVRRQAVRR